MYPIPVYISILNRISHLMYTTLFYTIQYNYKYFPLEYQYLSNKFNTWKLISHTYLPVFNISSSPCLLVSSPLYISLVLMWHFMIFSCVVVSLCHTFIHTCLCVYCYLNASDWYFHAVLWGWWLKVFTLFLSLCTDCIITFNLQ